MFLKGEFSNRLVQVSLFAALVYYITAYPVVFESARKYFPIKFKKTHHLLIFHTFVFMVLMYVLTYFVFDPLVRVVEGSDNQDNDQDNDQDSEILEKKVSEGNTYCAEYFNNIWDAKNNICNYEDGRQVRYVCSDPKKTPSLDDDKRTLVCNS